LSIIINEATTSKKTAPTSPIEDKTWDDVEVTSEPSNLISTGVFTKLKSIGGIVPSKLKVKDLFKFCPFARDERNAK
jgi:hypothetical protein